MGVGFLHGFLPQGISRDYILRPTKVRILITDETLFPKHLQNQLENELRVKFEVTVTRDWNSILAKTVASPSQDILLLPSYWAVTLKQQNLLYKISNNESELPQRIAPDFLDPETSKRSLYFFPFYWMKTGFKTTSGGSFEDFLKNKKDGTLFLLADEDLLLKHFRVWQDNGLLAAVQQKKILTLPLDQLASKEPREGAVELPLNENNPTLTVQDDLSALLIWGASIPESSDKKDLALDILTAFSTPSLQEGNLLKTPFNSTLLTVTDLSLPPQRRATHIRDLKLKGTLLIDAKNIEARKTLKEEFNLPL
ncbi:MAG: hypothetical protein J7501_00140 [Bdellovibrio sp.]|nr:hypothetical protein [Bdellovibrio sp.]